MERQTLNIRPGRPEDAALIADMNARMAEETEHKTLDRAVLMEGVRAVLADPSRGRYFIAELDGAVVGQTAITLEWSDWRNGWLWWLSSVYVHAAARRGGVFRALYEHVLAEARAAGDVVGLRLYVQPHNPIAPNAY